MIMADEIETTNPDGAAKQADAPIVAPAHSAPVPAPVPVPSPEPADEHANETEYERMQRLKLDTADAPHSGAIDQDIAKILEEVKLPERRQTAPSGDPKAAPKHVAPDAAAAPKSTDQKPETPPKPEGRNPVTALHTLKDDVQNVVREHKISLVRASALEEDKKRDLPKAFVPNPAAAARRRRTVGFLFASVLLIALGAAALYGVAIVSQKRSETPAQQYPSIIFAEQTETLAIDNLTQSDLKATIAQARAQDNAPLGSITRIVPTISTTTAAGQAVTEPATTQQFFDVLGVQASGSLLRGLGSTFFLGIHTVDKNVPVLVIPVTNYDLAFAGMLAWEATIDQDLAPAFDAVPALTTDGNGLPVQRAFSDTVMLNYDVRVLKDDSGNAVLYYSFPTPNILIIAESPNTFSEILSRLEAQGKL